MTQPVAHGRDIAKYQNIAGKHAGIPGDGIDWPKVKPMPVFDLVKVCNGTKVDPYAIGNINGMLRVGSPIVGGYIYFNEAVTPQATYDTFMRTIAQTKLEKYPGLVVMVDFEPDGKTDWTTKCAELLHLLDNHFGYDRTWGYTAPWVTGGTKLVSAMPRRTWVISRYITDIRDPDSGWNLAKRMTMPIWQFTSRARFDGLAGPVDANTILNMDVIRRINIKEPPGPIVTPPPTHVVLAPRATLQYGSTGPEAYKLINHLKWFHWYPSQWINDKNDGRIGERAVLGIRRMQTVYGIKVDGKYGSLTERTHQAYLDRDKAR